MICIHYGHRVFSSEAFDSPKNLYFTKPHGGLWASSIDAKFGWKEWCDHTGFRNCNATNAFHFTIKEDANVLKIDSLEKAKSLPVQQCDLPVPTKFYDFEKMVRGGIDVIDFRLSECPDLYWEMLGWDCDSILILNPDVVIPCGEIDREVG